MSASFSLRVGVGVAALSCLLLGYAGAQQRSLQSSSSPSGSSASDASASRAGQSGRSSAAQSGQASSQASGQSGRTYTANYGATASTTGSNSEVEHFMANCLLAQNEGEVQLIDLAQQQAQNSSVKQFAQKMAQDHRQMIQQLQQIAGAQGSRSSSLGTGRSGSASATSTSDTTTNTSTDTTHTGTSGVSTTGRRNSNVSERDLPSTPGVSGTTSDTASNALPGSSGASGSSTTTGRSSLSSSQTTDLTGGVASASGGGALQQLGQLEREILDRKIQLTKEDLQQKQGAEFDKCFVSTVIPAHVHMIAELEVLEKQSQGQLAQIAQQARPIVQQHLEHAKQLVKQLEGQSGAAASQAERSSRTRTE